MRLVTRSLVLVLPGGVARGQSGRFLPAPHPEAHVVSILDARSGRVLRTVDVPDPWGLAVDRRIGVAYISDEDNAVSVLDLHSGEWCGRCRDRSGICQARLADGHFVPVVAAIDRPEEAIGLEGNPPVVGIHKEQRPQVVHARTEPLLGDGLCPGASPIAGLEEPVVPQNDPRALIGRQDEVMGTPSRCRERTRKPLLITTRMARR